MQPTGRLSGGVEGKAELLWTWKRLKADITLPDDW